MDRSWMYDMTNCGRVGLKPEFVKGVDGFVDYAMTLEPFQLNGLVKCPCKKCQCRNYENPDIVKFHLYRDGFKYAYTVWTSHGEVDNNFDRFQHYVVGESSSRAGVEPNVQDYRMHGVVQDANGMHSGFESGDHIEETPNDESRIEQLEAASRPLYDGCPHSQLSIAVRLVSIKSKWNVPRKAMDSMIELMQELFGPNIKILDNFDEAKRLVSLLASSGIPPCPGDEVGPTPRPIQHRVYGQQRGLTDEPNNDEDYDEDDEEDEDYYEDDEEDDDEHVANTP